MGYTSPISKWQSWDGAQVYLTPNPMCLAIFDNAFRTCRGGEAVLILMAHKKLLFLGHRIDEVIALKVT